LKTPFSITKFSKFNFTKTRRLDEKLHLAFITNNSQEFMIYYFFYYHIHLKNITSLLINQLIM